MPTNNTAERALRHAVLWRKMSGGTASARGSRFVERVLSVVATCRQQGRNVLGFLTDCFRARVEGWGSPYAPPGGDRPQPSPDRIMRFRFGAWGSLHVIAFLPLPIFSARSVRYPGVSVPSRGGRGTRTT